MRKLMLLFFCFWATLNLHGQMSSFVRAMPNTPQPSTFQPVIINNNTRTVTALSNANKNAVNIYEQDKKHKTEQQREVDLLNQEVAKYNTERMNAPGQRRFIDTNEYNKDLATFNDALLQLKTLLNGNSTPSLAKAFYITETAWGKPYLSEKEYYNVIYKSAAFIKKWMQQNKYNMNNNDDKQKAIQKFMSEHLSVTNVIKGKDGNVTLTKENHQPFFYDYDDYQAEKDHRNFFVTKCLATGGGQCSSLPMVYLLLAEQLNTPAYLTFAPNHSFIKYTNNKGEIENYEPTSNWHINDLWYQQNLFISADAIRSGIYLDTLNKQKIIANCMLDLATEYIRKMPNDEGKFIQDCIWESHFYFPKYNNINTYFIYSTLLKGWLSKYIAQQNITDLELIKNDEFASKLQQEYKQNEAYIKELGYQDMPSGLYEAMLKESEFKEKIQEAKKIDGKTKRNLFSTTR